MTPMIDIVFQLIIFFVVTTELDKQIFSRDIILAKSPHGPIIEKRDPRTIVIEIDSEGDVSISQRRLGYGMLHRVLSHAVNQYGQGTPVQIRADRATAHEHVRRVMEVCGQVGIWKISFVALKEEGQTGS